MKIVKSVVLSQSDIDRVSIYHSWGYAFSVCRYFLNRCLDDMHVVRVLNSHGVRVGYALEDSDGIM